MVSGKLPPAVLAANTRFEGSCEALEHLSHEEVVLTPGSLLTRLLWGICKRYIHICNIYIYIYVCI